MGEPRVVLCVRVHPSSAEKVTALADDRGVCRSAMLRHIFATGLEALERERALAEQETIRLAKLERGQKAKGLA